MLNEKYVRTILVILSAKNSRIGLKNHLMNELISTRLKTRRGGKHSYSPASSSQEGFTQINNNHECCPTHLTFLSVVELGLNHVDPSLSGSGSFLIKICRKSRGPEQVWEVQRPLNVHLAHETSPRDQCGAPPDRES